MTGRLRDEEKSKLLTLAESLVPKEGITAVCAYGSRVAGYGREDSDYDIIVVAKNYKEKLLDKLEQKPVKSSPLIVDEAALLNAARRPTLGEFVVGRFLNIYEPIFNAEFLRNVEIEYKKRLIAEGLMELQSDYAEFSSCLIIPYEYFLFDKLHKRALEYPDALDSYARTYSGPEGKENLEFTVRGFREAAELLASKEVMEKTDDSVRIFRGKKKRMKALSELYKMYPLTTGGAIRYALHELGSRAGFEFKTEPLPKLKIMEKVQSTIELDRPNRLLRLDEGVVFDDATNLVEELARMSGFGKTYAFEEKKKGDFINSTKQLEIWDAGRRAKFILKHFPELKSVKWLLLNVWSLASKKFNMSPLSRLSREIEAARRLRELKIKTHRIIGVILDERTLISEYVEGVPLSKTVDEITSGKSADASNVEKYGRVLGKLHKAGLVYGDTKPQNALVGKDGDIDLLDLEQAVERGDKAWDLAEFLYFSATHMEKKDDEKEKKSDGEAKKKQEEGIKIVAEAFLTGYRGENGTQVIAKARNVRYLLPFVLFISPNMRMVVRNALKRYSSGDGASR